MAIRKALFVLGLALPLMLTLVGSASALTLTLHGTGFDASGNPLSSGATTGGVDGSWTIPAGSPAFPASTQAFFIAPGNADWWAGGGNPSDAYAPNTNTATFNGSGWISNNASSSFNGPAPYTFSMTFDLSSFDVTSVTIAGQWSIADAGELLINGHVVASLSDAWQTLHPFTITDVGPDAGFLNPGLNTLSLRVTASDNLFEAARFEGSATGSPVAAVPEPATLLLFGTGVAGLGFVRRLRAKRGDEIPPR